MSTVLITGAARGLGLDFTKQYAAKGWKVLACARKPDALKGIAGDVHHYPLEVTDYGAVKALAAKLADEPIDVLICNAGVGGEGGADAQTLGTLRPDVWRTVFEVNTLAPLMMAEAFADHVARSSQRKLIAISSTLGSIANNTGGRYFYRASKTALNMEWSCLAKDLESKGVICVALHPGWVQTDMGGPTATLTIEQSVPAMVKVIDGLKPSDNGRFLQYDGAELPW
ncbi:Short-chain dehydrogenase [Enhydrobacter aerosaccus]|uniref:Short-chain dehydrogenase n=1 Tax=Enhydrobacter aerosaccus TaxID=225324 RepID=A0A1T4K355_9HYPH|nr:SDR family oxidoreductase [Enhydrobacter aerosaccus]SJZ36854.1 Short-chain dehydrogenase [Enhydrobacter aerosaccus]